MPTTKDSFEQLGRRALGPRPARRVLALVLALTLLTRLPLFTIGLGIDEGGYSAVAAQWHPLHAGTSTYGNLFLDRPPLLLLLVKASLIFGNAGMRVLGMVCALSIVGGVWLAARRLLGPAGAIIAAPLAAVYASIVVTGAIFTNAELVAAPFGVWSVAVAAGVLPTMWPGAAGAPRAKSPLRSLLLAGALAGCASMCKQNFVDAGIAVLAALAVAVVVERRAARESGPVREADLQAEAPRIKLGWRHVAAFIAGGLAVLGAALTWVVVSGPGAAGMWEALFVFRTDVAKVISHGSVAPSQLRALKLVVLAGVLGMLPIVVMTVALQVRAFRRTPVLSTLILTWLAVATAGVILGGSYWVHYVQQIAFPVALAGGYVAQRARGNLRLMRVVVLLTLSLVAGLIVINASAGVMLPVKPYHVRDTEIGAWVGDHARPGDTIWVEYARANLMHASTLPTPYPYLWSLMVRGRPNAVNQLHALLDSRQRPNWVVRWNIDNNWKLDPAGVTRATLSRNYTKVGTVCGVDIMHDTATLATSGIRRAGPLYNGCTHRQSGDALFGLVD